LKLVVVREDGTLETISLEGKWEVVEGLHLNRLRSDAGLEHFFTPDGHYDGWGNGGKRPRDAN